MAVADKRPSLIEYSGIRDGRDFTRGFVGAIHKYLPTQDSLLNLKSGGDLELYELVSQDDQVKSCLQQRFRAVTAKDWQVIAGGDKRIDKQAAEHLQKQLEAIRWDDCNEKMLWGIFYGYSAAEVLWQRVDDKVTIADIKVRNRRRFHFNADQQLVLKTFQNPLGEDLPERKFWHFCAGADHDDEPYGRGLGHWLYWPTFFKRNGVRWWLKFIEKYAKPTRLGKYPAGATIAEKDVLWNALDSFGDDDRSMIPEGLEMLFLESARSGTVDYKALCDQMDGAIAKIILSQTMTTDDGSSKSQAEVHEGVKDEVIESDSDLLCESFNNSVAVWLTNWNYPGAAYPKVRRKIQADPDPATMAETDTKLQGLGISLKPEAIAAKYGEDYLVPDNADSIPQLNGEQVNALVSIITNAKQGGWSAELVAGMINGAFPNWPDDAVSAITDNLGDPTPVAGQVPGAPPTPDPQTLATPATQSLDDVAAQFSNGVDQIVGAHVCEETIYCTFIDRQKIIECELDDDRIKLKLRADTTQFTEKPDPIDPILTQLKPIGDATFSEWFTQLQGLMQESDNLTEFRDKLTDAYPDLDAAEFKQAMLDASVVAGMKGYSDAIDPDLEFAMSDLEVEFKIPPGTTKVKNGVTYTLVNSRWTKNPTAAAAKTKTKTKTTVPVPTPAPVATTPAKSPKGTTTKKTKAIAIASDKPLSPSPDPKSDPKAGTKADIRLNQANLDKHVAEIEKRAGGADIASINKNIGNILSSEDTGVFVRVGSSHVLNQILGGGFKNSVELGSEASVPGLKGSYLDARKRVESEQLGYAVDHDPTKRPIYAYAGNANDLNSSSHKDIASFGEITVKLRNETKDRSSFTGADSFKSGVASSMKDPSVGSIIQSHKHGNKTGISDVQSQLDKIGKSKNIDDLVKASSGIGNRYAEVQVHGGVKPSDIGEIHYKSNGEPPIPDQRIRDWAKANDVKIYQNGKLYEHREVSAERRAEIAKTATKQDYQDYIDSRSGGKSGFASSGDHDITYTAYKKKYFPLLTADNYKDSVKKSIDSGGIFSGKTSHLNKHFTTAEVAELKTKSDKNKSQLANPKSVDKDLFKDFDAILSDPIVSEKDRAAYKPKMSEAEAADYVKGSAAEKLKLYHGGSDGAIASIAGGGAKMGANSTAVYGGGFYMASAASEAREYARNNGGKDALRMHAKMNNPLVYNTAKDYFDDVKNNFPDLNDSSRAEVLGGRFGGSTSAHQSAFAKLKGYDGMFIKDKGYAIAFEKEQVVTSGTTDRKKISDNLESNGKLLKTKSI